MAKILAGVVAGAASSRLRQKSASGQGTCPTAGCGEGTTCCGGQCLNTATDALNCGGCGTACPSGERCDQGHCVCGFQECHPDAACCADVCTDLAADPNNCGGCANACPRGEGCVGGQCACGFQECVPGAWCCADVCTDLAADPNNCGGCGTACPSGERCDQGHCVCGFQECHPDAACCADVCTDLAADPNNCGGCANACPTGASCVQAKCQCPTTAPDVCANACVDTTSDPNNCGGCANACATGASCSEGHCYAILSFDDTAVQLNRQRRGGASPNPSVCGDVGIGKGFLQSDKVLYEWTPIVGGPDSRIPTVGQPQFFASGSVDKPHISQHDVRASHPFGFDAEFDIILDPVFLDLNYVPPGTGNNGPLHVEIEQGLFPGDPQASNFLHNGDRVLVMGSWIMDCGHPETYHTEIHPPTFLAYARGSRSDREAQTVSQAFANPYRVSQLYNTRAELAAAFDNSERFTDGDTKPFAAHVHEEVDKAVHLKSKVLEAHGLVEATRFDTITWFVCAPKPANPDAKFRYAYYFSARTGVTIQVTPRDGGCVQVQAVMSSAYSPMPITPKHVSWPWSQINKDATDEAGEPGKPIDVKQMFCDQIKVTIYVIGVGDVDIPLDPGCVNLIFHNDPIIDAYDPLQAPGATISDLGRDNIDVPPTLTTSADDQPFPFIGWVTARWE